MLVSFPHLFAEIDSKYSEYKDKKIELAAFPSTFSLEIIFPHYLEAEELGKIFYSLYNKLFYLFNYLEYQIKFTSFPEIIEAILQNYLVFLYLNPFL
jgi:hypothetical protein